MTGGRASSDPPVVVDVINGPNLNLLGRREVELYGPSTLADIEARLLAMAKGLHVSLTFFQSNHEGAIIDRLHHAQDNAGGVLLNAGAFAHTSLAIADAVRSIRPVPVVEIHLTNTLRRGGLRAQAPVGEVCTGRVEGFGAISYELGLRGMASHLAGA